MISHFDGSNNISPTVDDVCLFQSYLFIPLMFNNIINTKVEIQLQILIFQNPLRLYIRTVLL